MQECKKVNSQLESRTLQLLIEWDQVVGAYY